MRLFIFYIIFTLTSCSTDTQPTNQRLSNFPDTTTVKNWLVNVITEYLASDKGKESHDRLRTTLTSDYYNYKIEWITLEYNDEMTEAQFQQKWKSRYDSEHVRTGGFFISVYLNIKHCYSF